MKKEHVFDGPPELFLEFVRIFQIERTSGDNNDPFFWVVDIDRVGTKSYHMVLLWDSKRNLRTLSFIKVQGIPNGKSRLVVNISEKYSPWWDLLRNEIERQRGLSIDKSAGSPRVRKMKPWRERRANIFKVIKDEVPESGYKEVATKATIQAMNLIKQDLPLHNIGRSPQTEDEKIMVIFREEWSHGKDSFSEEDVRNDFKANGWAWDSSKKIR